MKQKKNLVVVAIVALLVTILLPDLQSHVFDTLNQLDSNTVSLAIVAPMMAPLKWEIGKNNMGGYKPRLLFIPESAVTSIPVVAYDDTKKMFVASGAFAFKTGTDDLSKPIYLYSTDGTVEYKAEPQGEKDGISYKQTLAFFFPGNLPEMHLFNALVKNTPGYYVYEDVDGIQYLMGEDGLPSYTSPSFDGGKERSSRRGTSYTATADSNYSAVLMGTPIDMLVVGGYKDAAVPVEG